MSYRLKTSESLREGIKRIAREEIESAESVLRRTSATNRDKAIHEARKSIKKARALLRLIRPQLNGLYDDDNRRLRKIAQKLSAYRDAKAMIEIFDNLKRKFKNKLSRAAARSIRRALLQRKGEREHRIHTAQTLKSGADSLRAVGNSVNKWKLGRDFGSIAAGVARTYRRGRKAMALVRKNSRPEYCHEWRKRVKDSWYHMRLLENAWPDWIQGYEKSLQDLETWLGDHHNLQVLRQTLAAKPGRYGQREDVDRSLHLAEKYQQELRKNALSLGERIYDEKPGLLKKQIKDFWNSSQSQPKSLKQFEKEKRKTA